MSNLSNSQCLSLRLLSLISGSCLDGIRHWTRRKSRPSAKIDAKRVVSLVKEEDNQKEAEEREQYLVMRRRSGVFKVNLYPASFSST